jgi:hypothetical protein
MEDIALMKFALNYSPEAQELLQSGIIAPDLFKCPDWDDLSATAAQHLPIYIHFPFQAGERFINPVQMNTAMDAAQRWLDRTETPYVNTHISPATSQLVNPDDADEVVDRVVRDILPLVERFGADKVIAENIPYPERNHGAHPPLSADANVITRVIETCDCGLLLDLGHARRTAEHLAIDPRRYIEQLPVQRLREVHVTGLGYDPRGLRVDHLPMREDDWELLDWALANIARGDWAEPWVVACEYGGIGEIFRWRSNIDVIAAQIPRMIEMVKAAQPVNV